VPSEYRIGQYEILRKIAVGGMGTVYAAVSRGPDGFSKLVAIKQLHPHLELGETARRRFAGEARLGAQLSHPNIVDVLGFEVSEDTHSIVMEYVHGCNLATLMRERQGRPLSAGEAAFVGCEVLKGLEAVHGFHTLTGEPQPVVHRDVSPRNILLSAAGEVKLADFGVALIAGEGFTTTTGLRGTVAYMSPEQATGEAVDLRSDVFSLGLVLYELLSGQRAYDGATEIALLNQAQQGPRLPLQLAGVNAELVRVLERALAHGREARYPDAAGFRDELERCLERLGRPTSDAMAALVHPLVGSVDELVELAQDRGRVTLPEAPVEPGRSRRRRPMVLVLLAALFLVAAGAVGTWLALNEPARSGGADASPPARPDVALLSPPAPPDSTMARADASPPRADAKAPRRRRRRPKPHRVARGVLHINTSPVWSEIWIDGRRRGTTPAQIRLQAGRHRVMLRARGRGRPVRLRVRILPGQTTTKVIKVPHE
jgi:hypothetical protein